MVFGTVHDEADFRLDRAAREHAHAASSLATFLANRLKDAGDRGLSDRFVDDDPDGASVSCLTIKMTVRLKCGSPIEGAATSNWPANEGRSGASSGFAGNAAQRRAVCRTYEKITPRRRHPIADMARSRRWGGVRLARTRVPRKECAALRQPGAGGATKEPAAKSRE
jgi:hypothetical protein